MHFVQTGFVIFHLWVSYLYIIIIIIICDGDTIDSMISLYSKSHFLEHAVVIVWKWRIYIYIYIMCVCVCVRERLIHCLVCQGLQFLSFALQPDFGEETSLASK